MKNLLNSSVLIACLSILTLGEGCRKDSPIPEVQQTINQPDTCSPCVTCKGFPESSEFGYMFAEIGTQYLSPCFNPNNKNELVYIRQTSTYTNELVKYNLQTKTEDILYNNLFVSGKPSWSINGDIIFGVYVGIVYIYKIKDDGTGLTQITNYNSYKPLFDNFSSNFICAGQHPNISGLYLPIFNINGSLIDSFKIEYGNTNIGIPCFPTAPLFNSGYFLYAKNQNGLNVEQGVCKYENDTISNLITINHKYQIIDMSAYSNKVYVCEFWNDIHQIDLNTNNVSTFIEGCQTKFYNTISISPDGTKMLTEKIINTPQDNGDIIRQHEIWLIDLATKEETKILGQ